MLNHSLGSATVGESSVLVTDGGVDMVSVLFKLFGFCVEVEMSSRPISRSRVLLNSLETSYMGTNMIVFIIASLSNLTSRKKGGKLIKPT